MGLDWNPITKALLPPSRDWPRSMKTELTKTDLNLEKTDEYFQKSEGKSIKVDWRWLWSFRPEGGAKQQLRLKWWKIVSILYWNAHLTYGFRTEIRTGKARHCCTASELANVTSLCKCGANAVKITWTLEICLLIFVHHCLSGPNRAMLLRCAMRFESHTPKSPALQKCFFH